MYFHMLLERAVQSRGFCMSSQCLGNCQDEIFKGGFESGDLSEWE